MTPLIQILGVDDHPLVCEGIAAVIASQRDMRLVGQATTGREAVELYRAMRPDVTLMDLRLPDMTGIEALEAIRREFPQARVVMVSTFEGDAEIQRALAAGARAYLPKTLPPRELADAIRQVHAGLRHIPMGVAMSLAEHFGEETLTDRERDVMERVAGGYTNGEIAEHLQIAEETVKVHLRNSKDKLGARDRTDAVLIAIRRGIIHV